MFKKARGAAIALATTALLAGSLVGTTAVVAQDEEPFKLGMAVGGFACCDWMKSQGDVARALAEQRGWDYFELDNAGDSGGETAVNNARLFVQEGVDAVIQFQGNPDQNPAIAAILGAAGIPIITYDIAQEGMHFVGIDNLAAGIAGGEGLGALVRDQWNCEPDLVISAEGAGAGIVNEWRTGGMRTGLANICPDIPAEKWVSVETNGQATEGLPASLDLLAANPDAVRMAVVGLNDGGVLAVLNAADQLGRADEVMGWGQDGSFIVGDNVHPNLKGSVFYFLEGYAAYALTDVVDKIAAGEELEVKWEAGDPASQVTPCPVSVEEAKAIPGLQERVDAIVANPTTTLFDLFCPTA